MSVLPLRKDFTHHREMRRGGMGAAQTSSAASSLESNWQKICSNSLRMTLARTFRRPLERERGQDIMSMGVTERERGGEREEERGGERGRD